MRVLAWVHLYPPDHCAGAEMMLHEILTSLQARGHDVTVLCDSTSAPAFDGVPVASWKDMTPAQRAEAVDWADVVITHLDRTRQVIGEVARRRPIVHLVHNDRQLAYHRVHPRDAQLVVANSQWIRSAITRGPRGWRGEVLVVRPPVHADRYRVHTTDAYALTLVNLSVSKGAGTFWRLAEAMPDRLFLGVLGGYDAQVVPDVVPPNVTVLEHGPDMIRVYRRTRILLCPSAYESWGRVGVEAMASGIPTIAHPTPGLLESLRGSGTFVDRDDIDGWIEEIRMLDDDAIYAARSWQALERSRQLDPTPDMDRLEYALLALTPKGS